MFRATILFALLLWMWTFQRCPVSLDDPPVVFWIISVIFAICVSASIFRFGITYFLIQAGSAMVDEPKVARLVRRLPEDFCGKIVHLAIDGHIVWVITNVGTFDLQMRFSDAVDEVSEIMGICVDGSHWVASAKITETTTVKGSPCLVMSNGDMVPVSRKYEPDLGVLAIL